jgi:RNA polymerase sigma factor (sigma-70 family)
VTQPFPEFDPEMSALIARCLPRLERWASGRLSVALRSMNDTGDLVQDAVINALRHLQPNQITTEGAMLAYLHQAIRNRIIDQYRRHQRRPARVEMPVDIAANETSPIEAAIGVETMERYEQALESLRDKDRQLLVLHVELGMTPVEIAESLGLSTKGAARMAIGRALANLALAMKPESGLSPSKSSG